MNGSSPLPKTLLVFAVCPVKNCWLHLLFSRKNRNQKPKTQSDIIGKKDLVGIKKGPGRLSRAHLGQTSAKERKEAKQAGAQQPLPLLPMT